MKRLIQAAPFAVLLLLSACGNDHGAKAEKTDAHDEEHTADEIILTTTQAKEAGVQVETVKRGPFAAAFKAAGRITAPVGAETTVAATATGIVRLTPAVRAEGTLVKNGATVAYISARNLPEGDPVAKLRVNCETARQAYERAKKLVKDHIITQGEYEQARAAYDNARIAYEAQASSNSAAGIAVKAPAGGYVKQLLVQPGDYVNVGQPLVRLTSIRRMQLRVDVPERLFGQIDAIRSARFRTPYDEQVFSLDELNGRPVSRGRVTDGAPYVPLTFEFDNKGNIPAGACVEVWLLANELPEAISIPLTSVTEEQGLYYVYLQEGSDVYHKQEVTLGADNGRRILVTSGLKGGERIVTAGAPRVRLAAFSGVVPDGHNHEH